MWNKQRGFTLIELMITVAIVAILAGVAYPAYTSHVIKAQRRNAQAQMMDIANRQQQYLLANRAYATKTELTASGYALPSDVNARYPWTGVTIETNTTVTPATSVPAFTVTFVPTGKQATDGSLTLNSGGTKGCVPACSNPGTKW